MSGWTIVLVAACLLADPAANDDLAPQVRKLVKQLDAAELATREDSEQALLDLGHAALDLLPAEAERMSAEAKQRLARVRKKLQQARAESYTDGSTVTLAAEERTLAETLAEFERQTGNHLLDFREQFGQEADDATLQIEFDKKPFWPALDEALDQAQMTVYGYAGEPGIAVVQRAPHVAPRGGRASYQGAFRVEAVQMEAHRQLRDAQQAGLQLQLEIAWEPRLRPLGIRQSLADVALEDEQGQAIRPLADEAELEALVTPGTMLTDLALPLIPPPRGSQEIALLRGKLRVLLPGGVETFSFGDLVKARKVQQRRGGVEVTLDEVRKNNDLWEVRMRAAFDTTSGALESHRGWVFDNEAYLLGPDKQPLAHDGFETTLQAEDEVGVAYLFEAPGDLAGYTFVYKTPVVVLDVPIEYELKHLPLP